MSQYWGLSLWLVATAAMAFWTRHRGASFCCGFILARGLIYYDSAQNGLPEFGGILHQIGFGFYGWAMAHILQRRFGITKPSSAPLTFFADPKYCQLIRFLTASLLCSGLAWGLTIELLVLPSEAMFANLRHWDVNLLPSPTVEYSLRMVGITFTAIGFLFFFVVADLEKYFAVVPLLGAFMTLIGLTLLAFGRNIKELDERGWFDGLSCLVLGVAIVFLWLMCHNRLKAYQNGSCSTEPSGVL